MSLRKYILICVNIGHEKTER